MSFASQLAQMMAGYDISDEEYNRLMDAAQEKERCRIENLAKEAAWKKAWEEERRKEWEFAWWMEMYGRVLPDFYPGMPYKIYLDTHRWKATAEHIKSRDKGKCRVCKSTQHLHVHHRTYAHIYEEMFNEDDLITLCRDCHKNHHAGIINIETLLNLPKVGRCV